MTVIIDKLIASLHTEFMLTDEGDINGFLGIDVKNLPDGSYELMQSGFIDHIIKEVRLKDEYKYHATPAVLKLLSKDEDSEAHEYSWNYQIVIGMLNYLSTTTQKDILFAICTNVLISQTS